MMSAVLTGGGNGSAITACTVSFDNLVFAKVRWRSERCPEVFSADTLRTGGTRHGRTAMNREDHELAACAGGSAADGSVACATCTNDDPSAAMSCRSGGMFSAVASWEVAVPDGDVFVRCSLVAGARVRMINTPRGLQPELAAP